MKNFWNEFKAFIMRGNVMELAVGVIVGAAFKAIVDSLVGDIISPIIGLVAKKDFSHLVWNVFDAQIRYGAFITAVINFLLMALIIFMLVKGMNHLTGLAHHKEEQAEAEEARKCPYCCTEVAKEATRCPHCTSLLEEKE